MAFKRIYFGSKITGSTPPATTWKLYVNTTQVSAMYVGSTEVTQAYVNTTVLK